MLISITKSANIGAAQTETPGLIIKSEAAYIRIFDKRKRGKKAILYSCDQLISCMTTQIFHN